MGNEWEGGEGVTGRQWTWVSRRAAASVSRTTASNHKPETVPFGAPLAAHPRAVASATVARPESRPSGPTRNSQLGGTMLTRREKS
eukprot:scaffold3603_cov136-Isochrysis_galbana.AAC.10